MTSISAPINISELEPKNYFFPLASAAANFSFT